MPESHVHTWESVLASCEASAAHAEALLADRGRFDPERFADLVTVDLWQLNLGPLPADLTDRARTVHQRQLHLQGELVAAMTAIHQQILISSASEQGRKAPQYLDCSA
jgi:hypothetical protein